MTARTWTAAEIQAKAEEVVCRYAEFRRLLDGTYSGDMRRALAAVFSLPEPEPVLREEPDPIFSACRWRVRDGQIEVWAPGYWGTPPAIWFWNVEPYLPARLRLIADLCEYPYRNPVTGEKMKAKVTP